ncbi:MAG: hypothetical protein IT317_19955 [Anaerolineales bacterium]|nr:hypothetical protein [Anaerolineales bacterium]
MSIVAMNEVVGKAVISESFCAGLFNGRRAEMLSQYAGRLDADEYAALLNIEAEGLADFAAAIEQWAAQRETERPTVPTDEAAFLTVTGWPHVVRLAACLPHA